MSEELKPCEKWNPIPGYECLYDVSNRGQVRSWRAGTKSLGEPRIKVIQKDKDGYPFVLLYKNQHPVGFRVSRLVLLSFIGQPPPGMEASHVDENKENNNLENLIWESRQANEDRKTNRPTGERNHFHKLTESDVVKIREMRDAGCKLIEIADLFGITQTNVSFIARRKSWKNI